jgi:hypothetical protein
LGGRLTIPEEEVEAASAVDTLEDVPSQDGAADEGVTQMARAAETVVAQGTGR